MIDMKRIIYQLMTVFVVAMGVTGCYKEPDLFDELLVSKGKVAQIPVVWLGDEKRFNASGVLQPGMAVDAGTTVKVNLEYTTEIGVKEFKIYTTPAGGQKYDATLRNYILAIPIKAPADKGASMVIFAEIITDNDLASSQKSVTLTTNK